MRAQVLQGLNPKSFFEKDAGKTTIILVMASLLPTLHRYFCSPGLNGRILNWQGDFFHTVAMFACAFFLFGLLPLAIIHFYCRESSADYGLRIGEWRTWLPVTLILFLIIAAALLYPASKTEAMRGFYPFDKSATDAAGFIRLQLFRGLLFYSAWEFLFRGFILFGLKNKLGN